MPSRRMSTAYSLLRWLRLCCAPAAAAAQTIEEKAQLCTACHGEAGIPQEKATPIIWGQNEGYLYFSFATSRAARARTNTCRRSPPTCRRTT